MIKSNFGFQTLFSVCLLLTSIAGQAQTTIIPVQPASAWQITRYDSSDVYCLAQISNPVVTGVVDVVTPNGPGVRTDALGTTLACCGCAFASNTIPLSQDFTTVNGEFSFYYDADFSGFYSSNSITFTLLDNGSDVATQQFTAFPTRSNNCGGGPQIQRGQTVTVDLDQHFGIHNFDAIRIELQHYACIGSNYQVISEISMNATVALPVPTLSQWGLIILGLTLLCLGAIALFNKKRDYSFPNSG